MLMLLALALTLATARVEWEVPQECPDRSWLSARVEAYLGRALAPGDEARVYARIEARHGTFVLELDTEVDGARAQPQRLEHHDCTALAEQAASLAAITIDPLALTLPLSAPPRTHLERSPRPVVQRPTRRSPTPTPLEPAQAPELAARPPEPTPTPEPEPEPLPPEAPLLPFELGPLEAIDPTQPSDTPAVPGRAPRLVLAASGGLALNLFPNPAAQLGGGLGARWENARVDAQVLVEGEAMLAGRFRSTDGEAGGDLLAWDVSLRPCAIPHWGIVELRTCAGVGAGQIRASSVGVANGVDRAHPWVWLAAQAGVAVQLQRNVAVVLDLAGRFSVLRPNFSVENPDASYLTPVAAGLGQLGLELRFR